jgi:FG-GAP-like repeat
MGVCRDGFGDLLWGGRSGDLAVWLMSGAMVMSSASLGTVPTNWTVVGIGDFNGDGMADILWRDNLGNTSIWLMNGTTHSATREQSPMGRGGAQEARWHVLGAGSGGTSRRAHGGAPGEGGGALGGSA